MGSEAPQGSCPNCKYIYNDKCTWFKYFKDEESKTIPNKIMNKGCELYCDHPLTLEIIKLFK